MFSSTEKHSATEAVDIIEGIVFQSLREAGFRKHGRTLHRFVDGDLSQVIHFQSGLPTMGMGGQLCVNLGIRVPESAERSFAVSEPPKKYYHEYECNIRCRLSQLTDGRDIWYDLSKNPEKTGKDILRKLEAYALPIFDALNSRDAILAHRAEYPAFDDFRDLMSLEEAMIYGRRGELSRAEELFREYYAGELAWYLEKLEHGTKKYLQAGETLIYRNSKTGKTETLAPTQSGYVTVFDASDAHLRYLKELARKLHLDIE